MNPSNEVLALRNLAEQVLLEDWLEVESPSDRRRQAAMECVAEAGMLLHNACVNLGILHQPD